MQRVIRDARLHAVPDQLTSTSVELLQQMIRNRCRKLAEIDVDHMTPMEALALLAALKKEL